MLRAVVIITWELKVTPKKQRNDSSFLLQVLNLILESTLPFLQRLLPLQNWLPYDSLKE